MLEMVEQIENFISKWVYMLIIIVSIVNNIFIYILIMDNRFLKYALEKTNGLSDMHISMISDMLNVCLYLSPIILILSVIGLLSSLRR